VTQTVYGSTVTVPPIPQMVTQLVTITSTVEAAAVSPSSTSASVAVASSQAPGEVPNGQYIEFS